MPVSMRAGCRRVMVEWALALFRPSDLADLSAQLRLLPSEPGLAGGRQADARAAVTDAFGPPDWRRLYFGQEFCERRAPSVSDVRRAYAAAASAGLAFSLLTSYVSDEGLGRLRPVLAWLSGLGDPRIEVVANDWGVVRLVAREHAPLRLVLGRLMNRMLRDPRIVPGLVAARAPGDALSALRQPSLTAPAGRRLLERFGIGRVEFDNLIQGLDTDFAAIGLGASVYVPYGYVVTGRACAIGSLNQRAADQFHAGTACRRECLRYTVTRRVAPMPVADGHREYVERGNTCCYLQDAAAIDRAAAVARRSGIDRLVYQADLPV